MRDLLFAGDPPGPDDFDLLARARAQDAAAFRTIFLRYGPSVRRLLVGLFRDAHAADEATQETFVRAHRSLGSLRDAGRLRAWLLGIARIVWLDEAERRRLEARVPLFVERRLRAAAPSAEAHVLDAEADRALGDALARLSPHRRTALLLRLDQGLGYAEIAAVLGWPLHKVKNEIHRARIEIRDELLEYLRGP